MLDSHAGADEGQQEFYLPLFFAQKRYGLLAEGIACPLALAVCDHCKPDALFHSGICAQKLSAGCKPSIAEKQWPFRVFLG